MKVHEVAQRLGVSKQVVYEMIKKKTLPSLKYPGTDIIRVLWSDFEAFVRASRQTGEDDLPELRPLPPITKDYFAEDPAQPPVKRKRGRPRKYPLPS
jgi:excisionase family DNA binding protein